MGDDQTDKANAKARELLGKEADAPAPGFEPRVLNGGETTGDGETPQFEFIKLPGEGRPLSQFADEMGRVCAERDVFRRETVPCTINPESGAMEAIVPDRFRTFVEDFAVTHVDKWSKAKEDFIKLPKTMTKDVAGGVLSADQFIYKLKRLDRVNNVRMPVMRRDGRIELLPEGYDRESHTYTMPSKIEIRDMQPEEARKVIDSLLQEFPFGDFDEHGFSRSKAVAIAGMLGLYGTCLLGLSGRRMNFVYTANSQRSGKSLLAQCAITPVTGGSEVQTIPDSKEEFRKVLDTEAIASSPCIFFDDLEGNIKNNTLNAFLTASVWTGRLMNSQKKFKAPKVSVVYLTGNNLTLSTDISGRTLLCELYVKEADPQARKVKRVIDEAYLSRDDVRGDLLSAMWALVQHWDAQGRPKPDRTIRGYEEWSNIFGGIIECNGWGNPLLRPDTAHSGDTEMTDMLDLVEYLVDELPAGETERDYDFQELGQICVESSYFTWMIDYTERSGEFPGSKVYELKPKSKAILGKMWTNKYGGRIFTMRSGQRVEFGSRGKNRQKKYLIQLLPS
ncbi:hypothetical protein QEH52_01695 [Coraliomargarita sp. SDUM461003]|uniref:DUF927 domain-containing protein n=1 Tax=Thalassobacterium maritimum TaxID=3041265 RepID=A0ABU1APV3_9BACT|nr:hypothetical protein [Coraliomargarita sp. SDUM461003]MDQ8206205.1 hypothetical protein [Coraliomargarita sp. SDUM461003]